MVSLYLLKWPRFCCICDFISLLMKLPQKKRPTFSHAYLLSANEPFAIIRTFFVSCFVCKLSSLSLDNRFQVKFSGSAARWSVVSCCASPGREAWLWHGGGRKQIEQELKRKCGCCLITMWRQCCWKGVSRGQAMTHSDATPPAFAERFFTHGIFNQADLFHSLSGCVPSFI